MDPTARTRIRMLVNGPFERKACQAGLDGTTATQYLTLQAERASAATTPTVAAAAPQLAASPASPSPQSSLPHFTVGDRVAAYTSYYSRKDHKDNRFGAFQQNVLCNESTVLKVTAMLFLHYYLVFPAY